MKPLIELTSVASATLPTRSAVPVRTVSALAAGVLIAASLIFAGCGGEPEGMKVTSEELKPIDPNASPEEQQSQRMKLAVAMRDGIEPPEPALKLSGGELATPEVLAAYNQELLRHIFRERETPETIQELLRVKTLPRLPTAPPGKRIVYDPANQMIRLDPP